MSFKWPRKVINRRNWFPFSFLIIATGKDGHKEEEKEQRKTKRRKEKDKINLWRKFVWETNN